MRTFNIKTPDKKIVPALQDKIDNLTKPKGSLGRLEELAVQIGTIQQSLSPVLRTPQNIVFAADHGVVVEGVSFSAPEVTEEQKPAEEADDSETGEVDFSVKTYFEKIIVTE